MAFQPLSLIEPGVRRPTLKLPVAGCRLPAGPQATTSSTMRSSRFIERRFYWQPVTGNRQLFVIHHAPHKETAMDEIDRDDEDDYEDEQIEQMIIDNGILLH